MVSTGWNMKIVLEDYALVCAIDFPEGANPYYLHRVDLGHFRISATHSDLHLVRRAVSIALSGERESPVRDRNTGENECRFRMSACERGNFSDKRERIGRGQ